MSPVPPESVERAGFWYPPAWLPWACLSLGLANFPVFIPILFNSTSRGAAAYNPDATGRLLVTLAWIQGGLAVAAAVTSTWRAIAAGGRKRNKLGLSVLAVVALLVAVSAPAWFLCEVLILTLLNGIGPVR